ncbi:hypothetical protein CB1_000385022 [Camelus ferus]|nr:hypothetical protein CB1_000385022 [Camelus ferus]
MVKLSCSFSGKSGKDPGDQDGAIMDSVPLISPLDVSQLQPSFADQVVIKTQTEYQLSSPDQSKKFSDLEAQKLSGSHSGHGRRVSTGRMLAFTLALLACVVIMYKAVWYDQFSCPDGFLLRMHRWAPPSRNATVVSGMPKEPMHEPALTRKLGGRSHTQTLQRLEDPAESRGALEGSRSLHCYKRLFSTWGPDGFGAHSLLWREILSVQP